MTSNDSYEKQPLIAENNVQPTEISQKQVNREERYVLTNQIPIRFAGFWMRFWAYLFDLIVIASIDRIIINPIFRLLKISLTEFNMFAPISIATAITFYTYFVLMTRFFNQTLGKMVFGLKVVDLEGRKLTWGTILFREWIGRFISATIVIGYVIVAFLPKKQGLHDLFTDTTVVHER